MAETALLDAADKALINRLQEGFPISSHPFAESGRELGLSEDDLLNRLKRLQENGLMTRFGPLYHAERLGGGLSLCAMAVPEDRFNEITELVNSYPEVAHNYERDHLLNMWFVLATEAPQRIAEVVQEITQRSGITVRNMPKIEEFFVGLKFTL
ncbi:MAG: AsnC family transcriptional regulator [Gammaproteobacteria bacterium]|nr:AsnC family transcriptional regulator [Gammaproteobacteria bacterium]